MTSAKPDGSLIVVGSKSTRTQKEISLDQWKQAYKRQMEINQWLPRRNGFTVSDSGYFLFVNANTDLPAFNGRLEFDMQIIPYEGCDDWVDEIIRAAWDCLTGDPLPDPSDECEWCAYRDTTHRQVTIAPVRRLADQRDVRSEGKTISGNYCKWQRQADGLRSGVDSEGRRGQERTGGPGVTRDGYLAASLTTASRCRRRRGRHRHSLRGSVRQSPAR